MKGGEPHSTTGNSRTAAISWRLLRALPHDIAIRITLKLDTMGCRASWTAWPLMQPSPSPGITSSRQISSQPLGDKTVQVEDQRWLQYLVIFVDFSKRAVLAPICKCCAGSDSGSRQSPTATATGMATAWDTSTDIIVITDRQNSNSL